jgi:RNA polymerase-associated protein CTR9
LFFFLASLFHILFLSEQKKLEEKRRLEIEELLKKRQEYREKTKNAILFGEMPSEKPAKKGSGRKRAEYISDSGGSDIGEGGSGTDKPHEKTKKRQRR